MTSIVVSGEVAKYRLLRERVLAVCPDADEDTLADTLEGLSNLKEIVGAIIRSALLDEALAEGLALRLKDMRCRQDRLEERASAKRALALEAMVEVGWRKLTESDFTASLRQKAPSLMVTSEAAIPAPYWVPQPPKLDRHGLLAALKLGESVAGASLSEPQSSLAVRTK